MDKTCRDLALKKGEFILVLDYEDLRTLLDAKRRAGSKAVGVLLVYKARDLDDIRMLHVTSAGSMGRNTSSSTSAVYRPKDTSMSGNPAPRG
jgi:hypothetical protein